MQAVCLRKPGLVETIEIKDPSLSPEDVMIKMHYLGLCGSDLSAFRGTSPMVSYPRIPGHEVSGEIIAKGENVPDWLTLGSRVTASPYTNCGKCPACRIGRTNTCQFNQTLGVQRDGALVERIAIPYTKVYPSDKLSFQELALVEPMSVGYHAANRGRISEVDTVLVFGCGAIGLGAIAASARKGAQVIAADVDDSKLALAAKLGARYTINSMIEDLQQRVKEITAGEGVNVAIEAVGLSETIRSSLELVVFAGRVVLIGYTKEDTSITTRLIVSKELDIIGSRNALNVFPAVIKMLEASERPFTDLVTRIVHLHETGQALADWNKTPGKTTKILVEIAEE
jgi:threonine dehydrogenase-like Zn-dependent dehydrogenase